MNLRTGPGNPGGKAEIVDFSLPCPLGRPLGGRLISRQLLAGR
jgi:hypothetical protein